MNSSQDASPRALAVQLVRSVRDEIRARRTIGATYRLQFAAGRFHFSDASRIASYLAELGVSHVYSSPFLQSRSGSTHGYDIVDHSRLNEELGGETGFNEFASTLQEHGLGLIPDIVPNHMSVATSRNAWWMDVLMNGPSSPYAAYFDIEWHPAKRELENRILLPVLGDLYGTVLEAGQLPIVYCEGAFYVACGDLRLPLDPQTAGPVLAPRIDELTESLGADSPDLLELQSILTAMQYLPGRNETAPERTAERHREIAVIQGRLRRLLEASDPIRWYVEVNLERLNGQSGEPASFDELDRLLDEQVFRLVHWKAGSDELNYRRFFDVTELAAVSTERLDVFDATHQLVFDLAVQGKADGFRVDHIDGLFDPAEYLWRLQWGFVRALGQRHFENRRDEGESISWEDIEPLFLKAAHRAFGGPDPLVVLGRPASSAHEASEQELFEEPAHIAELANRSMRESPLFVLVEKILGVDEPLPPHWPVQGTTGYDFLNLVNGLFVDSRGLREIERHYTRFTESKSDLKEIVYECKRLVLSASMQSEVQLLAYRLDRLSNRHRRSRDYTLQALRFAIREIIASFSVYRTYVRHGEISDRDRRVIQMAVGQARRRNPAAEASVFAFVRDTLLSTQPPDLHPEGIAQRDLFIGRFQQVTSPVMAKGVEDTAFYQYLPLTSLEEVGGEPSHAVISPDEFHRQNAARQVEWPRTMLATTTHDTKRTEDVRARINVLSERPSAWRSALQRWTRWNRKFCRDVDGQPAPSRNEEWLFYQTLVGMWPATLPDAEQRAIIIERLQNYMEKATREAKLRTSWISPNAAYDEAVRAFVAAVLEEPQSRFAQDFQAFHESIVDVGLLTALSQVVLKLTAPGIPDLYQGQELWDFSLVDPDNRRPVDYDRRRMLLSEIVSRAASEDSLRQLSRELAQNPRDDRLKLFVTWSCLQLRKRRPELFSNGGYQPLPVLGERAEHLCAFMRRETAGGHGSLLVVTPRLLGRLQDTHQNLPLDESVWLETHLQIDDDLMPTKFRNCMTGQTIATVNRRLMAKEIFQDFPVAVLESIHSDV